MNIKLSKSTALKVVQSALVVFLWPYLSIALSIGAGFFILLSLGLVPAFQAIWERKLIRFSFK